MAVYAVTYDFYNEGHSIIEIVKNIICFLIFEKQNQDEIVSANDIARLLERQLDTKLLSVDLVITLLKSLKKAKKVSFKNFQDIQIAEPALSEVKALSEEFSEVRKEKEHDIDKFLKTIHQELNNQYKEIEIENSLFSVFIPHLFSASKGDEYQVSDIDQAIYKVLQNDTKLFSMYVKIFQGKMLQIGLYEIRQNRKINLSLFLDTNILVELLGKGQDSKTIKKLLKICREKNIQISVLEITKNELLTLLKSSKSVVQKYKIEEADLNYVQLSFNTWVNEYGINVVPTDLEELLSQNENEGAIQDEDVKNNIPKHFSRQMSNKIVSGDTDDTLSKPQLAVDHDKAALFYISNIRSHKANATFQGAESTFLTNDTQILRNFSNFKETFKRNKGFVEAIDISTLYGFIVFSDGKVIQRINPIDIMVFSSYSKTDDLDPIALAGKIQKAIEEVSDRPINAANLAIFVDTNEMKPLVSTSSSLDKRIRIVKNAEKKYAEQQKIQQENKDLKQENEGLQSDKHKLTKKIKTMEDKHEKEKQQIDFQHKKDLEKRTKRQKNMMREECQSSAKKITWGIVSILAVVLVALIILPEFIQGFIFEVVRIVSAVLLPVFALLGLVPLGPDMRGKAIDHFANKCLQKKQRRLKKMK